jgi:hypothetical protein
MKKYRSRIGRASENWSAWRADECSLNKIWGESSEMGLPIDVPGQGTHEQTVRTSIAGASGSHEKSPASYVSDHVVLGAGISTKGEKVPAPFLFLVSLVYLVCFVDLVATNWQTATTAA